MTAYRQQALICAALVANGPSRPRDLKVTVPDAPKILLDNVYGWFVRIERGVYGLTDQGRAALIRWPQESQQMELPRLPPSGATIAALMKATGWRAAFRGQRRRDNAANEDVRQRAFNREI